jgi:hypothetical protein
MYISVLKRNGESRQEAGLKVTVWFEEGGSSTEYTNGSGVAFFDISRPTPNRIMVGNDDVYSFDKGSFDRHQSLAARTK